MNPGASEWRLPDSNAYLRDLRSNGWSPRLRTCTHAWPAHPTQRTLRVPLGATESARVHHAQVAEGEVVAHWVQRIKAPERGGDVLRHSPPGTRVTSQAKATPNADHVRVERDDELRRRHARPHAEIEAV